MVRTKLSLLPSEGIAANLQVMAELVGLVVEAIGEAQVLIADGKQAAAVAAVNSADGRLDEALLLHRAIMTLHRHR
jgi:hypothetical protein